MNNLEVLQQSFTNFLQKQFSIPAPQASSVSFSLNVDEQKQIFGDISSNAALVLSKLISKKPQEIAETIRAQFLDAVIDRIEIAGPGFLNFFLKPIFFQNLVKELIEQNDNFFKIPAGTIKKNYSVEFVSANPTGPLHLGHGRGGIIGDVLGNILKFLGYSATKEFYINDAGSQIEKLAQSFKVRCQQQLGFDNPMPEDGYQGDYLVDLAKKCIAEHGEQILEKPDSFFGDYAKNSLLEMIKQTLLDYGINFDVWFSEKTLHTSGAIEKSIKHLQERGALYEQEGALWFKATEYGDEKDRVIRKSNGELTYAAADIAYLENKIYRGFNHLIMVLGQDHHSYVVRLKGIMQALGYNPADLDIILYQLVTIKESGQAIRMSKRTGKIVTLKDIIETVGKDVARFFYLNRKSDAHLDFDLELALKKTEENPVYYIQYAYVRTLSILKKAKNEFNVTSQGVEDIDYLTHEEYLLIKKIVSLKELLIGISGHYQTHLLTYYVIELAQTFHRYYAHCRVIDLENLNQSRARLLMIQLINETLKRCLVLLGISCPETM